MSKDRVINPIEEQFVKSFIAPQKRDRYLSLLKTDKGRSKLLRDLNRPSDLDSRYAASIPSKEVTVDGIEKMLLRRGAPAICYVMSSNGLIDGQILPLREALADTIGYENGTLISCIDGKLGYFELEDGGEAYILEK
jgi:hypothetical protein